MRRTTLLRQALFHRIGSGRWDGLLRASGGVCLLAIPLVIWVPFTAPLIGFLLVTMWLHGPPAPPPTWLRPNGEC